MQLRPRLGLVDCQCTVGSNAGPVLLTRGRKAIINNIVDPVRRQRGSLSTIIVSAYLKLECSAAFPALAASCSGGGDDAIGYFVCAKRGPPVEKTLGDKV